MTAAAFAAQGFGYAAIVSTLPTFKGAPRPHRDADLGDPARRVGGRGGSVLADVIAVRRGSRWALAVGFGLQAVSLVVAINASTVAMFTVAVVVHGVGLGCVDAAANMAGALAEARSSTPLSGRLYAAYGRGDHGRTRHLGRPVDRAARTHTGHRRGGARRRRGGTPSWVVRGPVHHRSPADPRAIGPRASAAARIWMVGGLVFAAFVVDSAVATWSTLAHGGRTRHDEGGGTTGLCRLPRRRPGGPAGRRPDGPTLGRLHTGIVGSLVALVGCVLVVAVHAPGPAVVGFALAGGAAGLLVPVAFSWAGELDPDRSDEVVARVNLFNYGGALIGAVALGALAGNASALGFGFALPAVALVVALLLLRARTAGQRRHHCPIRAAIDQRRLVTAFPWQSASGPRR